MPDKTKCMASKAAVDLHDHLKRDMMTLFSLEKVLQKKVKRCFRCRRPRRCDCDCSCRRHVDAVTMSRGARSLFIFPFIPRGKK